MAIRSAKGTLQQIGDAASPEVFTTIGQVRSITGPTTKATVVDTTSHSTSGNWMERLAVLIDPGTNSFEINYDSSDAKHAFTTGLWSLMINLTGKHHRTVLPSTIGYMVYTAYVTQHSFNLPVNDVIKAAIELTINGAITAANTAAP